MIVKYYHKNLAVSKKIHTFAPRNKKKRQKNMKRFEMIRYIFDAVYKNGIMPFPTSTDNCHKCIKNF